MKRIIFCLLLLPFFINAQNQDNTGIAGIRSIKNTSTKNNIDIRLSAIFEYVYFSDKFMSSLGINAEIYLNSKFSFNYHVSIGSSYKNAFYIHGPLGGGIGVVLLSSLDNKNPDWINTIGVIALFIPEGISYHERISKIITLSPYFNPLGFEYSKKTFGDEFMPSGEIGIKADFNITKKIFIIPHIGIKKLYDVRGYGCETGISVSYFFDN